MQQRHRGPPHLSSSFSPTDSGQWLMADEEGLVSGRQAAVAKIAGRRTEWTPDDEGVLPCQHGHCEYPTQAT